MSVGAATATLGAATEGVGTSARGAVSKLITHSSVAGVVEAATSLR